VFANAFDRVIGDVGEDVAEVALGIEAAELDSRKNLPNFAGS